MEARQQAEKALKNAANKQEVATVEAELAMLGPACYDSARKKIRFLIGLINRVFYTLLATVFVKCKISVPLTTKQGQPTLTEIRQSK